MFYLLDIIGLFISFTTKQIINDAMEKIDFLARRRGRIFALVKSQKKTEFEFSFNFFSHSVENFKMSLLICS